MMPDEAPTRRQLASSDACLASLAGLFDSHGMKAELDGRMSNTEHMLQTAAAAEAAGAQACLVAAALLHDIGHWLHNQPVGLENSDAGHETIGARYLAPFFNPEVTRPIALHVAAKRYLCAREPDYFANLSPGSVRSLVLQGGPMSPAEASRFEQEPDFVHAVSLRRWDEYGKVAGLEVPGFEHYRGLLRSLMR